jgi:hypothetical protein
MATRRLPVVGGHEQGFAATLRSDTWWVAPATTLAVFTAFVIYATWAGLQGEYYYADPYLSPMYSPVLFTDSMANGSAPLHHAWFGAWPAWHWLAAIWPSWLPRSPSIWIIVFPLSFRFTCYYYRKAYYRAYSGSPPACAVGPLAQKRPYKGETAFLIFQNLHRYALPFALILIVILYYDGFAAFFRDGKFGFGVGTLILLINPTLIAAYTLGCHSFRHLIGGHDDCMSCGQETLKYGAWKRVSWLNVRHAQFAWASLLFVAFTDIYIRLVSMGVIRDLNTWDM